MLVFFGYSPMHKGYRYLHPPSKRVYLSRHVIFDKTIFPYANPTLLFSHGQQHSFFFSTCTKFAGGFFTPSSSGLSDAPTNPKILLCSKPPNATAQVTSNFPHTPVLSPLDPSSS
jgi:hypothetical protein